MFKRIEESVLKHPFSLKWFLIFELSFMLLGLVCYFVSPFLLSLCSIFYGNIFALRVFFAIIIGIPSALFILFGSGYIADKLC